MTGSDEQPTTGQRPSGGGPLSMIMDDGRRGDGERALASAIISFMQRRQALHAKPLTAQLDVQLSFAQLKLLFHLPYEESLPLGRLAESVGITPAALTQALGPVEEAGLIERTRSEVDKRVVEARMTDLGRTVLGQVRAHFEGRWDEAFADVDDSELASAARVLERVVGIFGRAHEGAGGSSGVHSDS